jgi:hypothetical protein
MRRETICASFITQLLFQAEFIRVPSLFATLGIFHVRVLLLIGVLVPLCISEGIGLQLLPIPCAVEPRPGLAEARASKVRTGVPSPPAQGKSISGRTEIVAPKLEGISQQQPIRMITDALLAARHFYISLPTPVYSKKIASGYSFIFASQGASRAPPLPA